jgi:CDGSH-type Zn-finger protein
MPQDQKNIPAIRCKPDGPLIVVGVENLSRQGGAAIASKEQMALCRCGASANKPFCDGSHLKTGFESAKQAERTPDAQQSYAGKTVTIRDNRGICAHAGICTETLPEVWRMQGGPWIDPDAAAAAEIADVIRRCPSGALALARNSAASKSDTSAGPAIMVAKDGPYHVTGIELSGEDWAKGANQTRYTLCRCGASKNKPFCDGSHWDAGFRDGGT